LYDSLSLVKGDGPVDAASSDPQQRQADAVARQLRVFINYRRDDTWAEAQLLYDRLANRFGSENVFLDGRSLRPGLKWLDEIKSHFDSCNVLLSLIGPRWISIMRERDQATAVGPAEDYVRTEIQHALKPGSGILVVPVLLGGEVSLKAEDLPRSLRALASIQVAQIRIEHFERDIELLISRLETVVREQSTIASEAATERREDRRIAPTSASAGGVTRSTEITPPANGVIFISYRRQDTDFPAAFLFDRLADHFGRDRVFKDVDSIPLGEDFVEVITSAVAACEVLLVLIGHHWLTITDENGRRRLDDPDDIMRLEIEAALKRKVHVVPILVEGVRIPRADQLPETLSSLTRRQALELSSSRFTLDSDRLLRELDRMLTN
jgi:TIR domain